MSKPQTIAVVLAAGMSTRMKSDIPKVMHRLAGLPVVDHVLASLDAAGINEAIVVLGPETADQADRFAPHTTVVQTERLGTGHAVRVALDASNTGEADILVVYGDTPFIAPKTIKALLGWRQEGAAAAVLGFCPATPHAYGRLITDGDQVSRIVEAADASSDELAVGLCNSGVLVADGRKLKAWVHALKNDNAKGEYYLTDVIAFANAENDTCRFTEGPVDELFGIDTRADLAVAEGIIQNRYRAAAMAGGVTPIDPASTFLSHDTTFGTDVEVGPFTVFGPGVTIGSHVSIKGFCHFESATIGDRATVGPYARLRPGTAVETCAHVGNFVEIKNARIEEGAKVNHLTYIGDARVGKAANIGAGTITANYDGFSKSLTDIGAGASIGSNTVLVAPVTVGDGAITGAGTVIRKDVPDNAIAVTDAAQKNREGTAKAYRAQRKAIKDTKRKDS